jgi:hypothetical protein
VFLCRQALPAATSGTKCSQEFVQIRFLNKAALIKTNDILTNVPPQREISMEGKNKNGEAVVESY